MSNISGSLTPASNDENRKNELKRKAREPLSFDSDPHVLQRLGNENADTRGGGLAVVEDKSNEP